MAEIQFYNSLTKQVELFTPKDEGKVRIYNCGPTVYKRQHIGNMRRYLFADFLRRTLEFLGYEVREITNITDVGHLTQDDIDAGEDKLEKAARTEKRSPQDIAKQQTELFFEDLRALNMEPAHLYPRATAHIQDMLELIQALIKNGHAYQTSSGIYFDVTTFPEYGKLSGNTLEKIESGARIEIREEKKHPFDFALWKLNDPGHLQQWDSPWGKGYPGWHIECSAMSLKYLGSEIDIHTGGEDNRFPHHENEIAQSEAATGKKFVRLWMHNRHLMLAGAKLSKREGEQITLGTLRENGFSPLAFRLLVLGSHYRSPLEFSWESLAAAQKNLETVKGLVRRLLTSPPPERGLSLVRRGTSPSQGEVGLQSEPDEVKKFSAALADDLNTPAALAVFMDYVHEVNKGTADGALLAQMDQVLGIIEPLRFEVEAETIPDEIKQLARQREEARKNKQFEEADRLRGEVEAKGYKLEDTNAGPRVIYSPYAKS